MAQKIGKLTATEVARIKEAGLYSDGGNLWLQVTPTGAKSWVFRYTLKRKPRWMGLGPVATITLAQARKTALDKRVMLLEGKDPLTEQRNEEARARLAAASEITFENAATQYMEAYKASWGTGYYEEWKATLRKYAYPIIGKISVGSIDTGLVMQILEPIWAKIPAVATRTRGKIESVLDWAKSREYRAGENPARWRGHLQNLLPRRSKIRAVRHYPAVPYAKIGDFMIDLRSRDSVTAAALEFTILTCARTNEALGAKWSEFDFSKNLWVIPGDRMKSAREHRVPLSTQALAVLERMRPLRNAHDYVFPNPDGGKQLAKQVMLYLMRYMGFRGLTVHGFRSSFRDWASDLTSFAWEVIELALAHTVGDLTETSYFRTDLAVKRARLMQAWGDYCDLPSVEQTDNVVAFNAAV